MICDNQASVSEKRFTSRGTAGLSSTDGALISTTEMSWEDDDI